MIFWIFVALFISSIIWTALEIYVVQHTGVFPSCIPAFMTGVTFVPTVIMLVIVTVVNLGAEGALAKYQSTYEVLYYQYVNDIYDNDNDLGLQGLMKDVQKYNESVAVGKKLQHDPWVGIFYANIYDDLKLIELK